MENILPQLDVSPDIILIDPPRKGCHPLVLDTILRLKPKQIVYISCQGATLARDLQYMCQKADYFLDLVQPIDFFPQTVHLESAAFLRRSDPNVI